MATKLSVQKPTTIGPSSGGEYDAVPPRYRGTGEYADPPNVETDEYMSSKSSYSRMSVVGPEKIQSNRVAEKVRRGPAKKKNLNERIM